MGYSPSKRQLKHMRHCHRLNLIVLGVEAVLDDNAKFHLVKTDLGVYIKVNYFLNDFSKPPTPSNRARFTDKDVYDKMFSIYEEFYLRNNNISEEVIIEKTKKMEEPKKEVKKRKLKVSGQPVVIKNKNVELDLFDLIDNAERESKQEESGIAN